MKGRVMLFSERRAYERMSRPRRVLHHIIRWLTTPRRMWPLWWAYRRTWPTDPAFRRRALASSSFPERWSRPAIERAAKRPIAPRHPATATVGAATLTLRPFHRSDTETAPTGSPSEAHEA